MTPSSLVLRVSPLLAFVALSGCNTAYREAFAAARDAAIRGDFVAAARAYRAACAAAPDDQEACGRVPTFVQKGTDQALTAARPACEAQDLDRCLPPLLDAKDLSGDHPEVNSLLGKASQVQTERCSRWNAEASLNDAAAQLACLQSRAAQLPVASYQALVSQRAEALSSKLTTLANTAHQQGTDGAATVLLSAAQCLTPAQGLSAHLSEARQGFITQSAIPVSARISGSVPGRIAEGLADLCPRLSSGLPVWARCVESGIAPGQPQPLELQVNATIQRVNETVSEELNHVRYLSGKRHVRNPERDVAEHRLERAEHMFQETEHDRNEQQKLCEQSKKTHDASCVGCAKGQEPKDSPCDKAKKLGEELVRRTSDRDTARQQLSNTPPLVPEDVYDTFTYAVRTHHWNSGYDFTLESNTPGAERAAQRSGVLAFEDQEHVGFPPANIPEDPLNVPPPQVYAEAFLKQLGPSVFEALQRDAQARAASRRAQCAALPNNWSTSWVQCWAEAALWGTGTEPQPNAFLQVLASSSGAREQPVCR